MQAAQRRGLTARDQQLEAEAKYGLLDTDEVQILHRLEEGPLDSPNSTSRATVEAIVQDLEEASADSDSAAHSSDYGYGYGYRRDDARVRGAVESPVGLIH